MAIVIPSSKTYQRENPKVRDNVIERIEVGAVEVVPDNEYETPVYNEKLLINNDLLENTPIPNSDTDGSYWGSSAGGFSATRISGSYVGYLNQKTFTVNVKIPVIGKNKYIKYLQTKVDENGNSNIKYSLFGIKKQGTATAQWDYKAVSTVAQITEGAISYSPPTNISEEQSIDFPNEISISENSDTAGQVSSFAKQSLIHWGNIKTAEAIDKTNYYEINLEIMGGLTVVKMTSYSFTNGNSATYLPPSTLSFSGVYEIFEPTSIEITLYGNTIGIDLTDKTVYINGQTQKKVHSVDGNELMQTTNYTVHNGTKYTAIDKMYGDTKTAYEKGKETATIRCSISDYYDGDQKIIAIDNSTGKMSFKLYDQVIPMVYGADGQDHYMSTYQDGSAKVFQVLGTNIYYDGAVWQELYLQEHGEVEQPVVPPQETLNAPTISLSGNTLTITTQDKWAETFAIFVDGVEKATVQISVNTTFNLATLNLAVGTHSITVTARASDYADSPASNAVNYTVIPDTPVEPDIPPEEEKYIIGEGLYEFVGDIYRPKYGVTNELYFSANETDYYSITVDSNGKIYFDDVYAGAIDENGTISMVDGFSEIIVYLEQEVSEEFYDWFTRNTIRLTIFKLYYESNEVVEEQRALFGSTWVEWAYSEYNKDGWTAYEYDNRIVRGNEYIDVDDVYETIEWLGMYRVQTI